MGGAVAAAGGAGVAWAVQAAHGAGGGPRTDGEMKRRWRRRETEENTWGGRAESKRRRGRGLRRRGV